MPGQVPISDLQDHLGYWLRAVSNHVSHGFAASVMAQGVTVAQWVVLRKLHGAAAQPPSQLADALGMTRGAITKLADRLLAKGLVVRKADPHDGRAQTLALTAAGRRLVPILARLADENDVAAFACLTPPERQGLAALLHKIIAARAITAVPIE